MSCVVCFNKECTCVKPRKLKKYTKEEINFLIRTYSTNHLKIEEIVILFNRKFKEKVTYQSVRYVLEKNGIKLRTRSEASLFSYSTRKQRPQASIRRALELGFCPTTGRRIG